MAERILLIEDDPRLAEMVKDYPNQPIDPANPPHPPAPLKGIYQGLQKYSHLNVPVLAVLSGFETTSM